MTETDGPRGGGGSGGDGTGHELLRRGRTSRYLGLLALLALVLALILLFAHNGGEVAGIPPGTRLAPFAVPLASSDIDGYSNVATHTGQGQAGKVPACSVRKAGVLNVCELYERGPVVLAIFVLGGSCPQVLSRMQALTSSFPGVQFAAVAIEGNAGDFFSLRRRLRALLRTRGVRLPVGIDRDGVLAGIYKVLSCPQVNFAYPGGIVQSHALLRTPDAAELRKRVAALVAGSRARGWQEPTG